MSLINGILIVWISIKKRILSSNRIELSMVKAIPDWDWNRREIYWFFGRQIKNTLIHFEFTSFVEILEM